MIRTFKLFKHALFYIIGFPFYLLLKLLSISPLLTDQAKIWSELKWRECRKYWERRFQVPVILLAFPFLILVYLLIPEQIISKIPLVNYLPEWLSQLHHQSYLGIMMSYLGFIVSVLVLRKVDKRNLKTMDEFLEAANEVLVSIGDNDSLKVTSPTLYIGGNYGWNEFKLYKRNFERLAKRGYTMDIYCLKFPIDVKILNHLISHTSFESLLLDDEFKNCNLFQFHKSIFRYNSKTDDPTAEHKYYKELFSFLKVIIQNSNAAFHFLDGTKLGIQSMNESNLISFSNQKNNHLLASYVLKDIDSSVFTNEKTVELIDSFVDNFRSENLL
ncbi:MAG: hypothetical protein JXQ96_17740 [Cyclobacteriaceae bacterium]